MNFFGGAFFTDLLPFKEKQKQKNFLFYYFRDDELDSSFRVENTE